MKEMLEKISYYYEFSNLAVIWWLTISNFCLIWELSFTVFLDASADEYERFVAVELFDGVYLQRAYYSEPK